MPVGPMYQVNRLRHAFYRAMQLDLEEMSQLLRDNKMFLVFMQIAVFAVLSELDRMPAVRLLETRETNARNVILLGGKETFERFGEPISQHLYRGGRYMLTLSLESSFQLIFAWKCVLILILLLNRLKHAIINDTRLTQASQEQAGLFLVRVQSKLKCFHVFYHTSLENIFQPLRPPMVVRPFTHVAEASSPLAALG
jgi:hypothetical protein